MNRTQTLEYQGKRIFFIDFSDLRTIEEIKMVIQSAQNYIHAQPAFSVNTLTTVEGTHFNNEIKDLFSEYIKSNKPFVKTSAIVGVTGLKQIMYNGLMAVSGRDTKICNTVDEAKAWLASIK